MVPVVTISDGTIQITADQDVPAPGVKTIFETPKKEGKTVSITATNTGNAPIIVTLEQEKGIFAKIIQPGDTISIPKEKTIEIEVGTQGVASSIHYTLVYSLDKERP